MQEIHFASHTIWELRGYLAVLTEYGVWRGCLRHRISLTFSMFPAGSKATDVLCVLNRTFPAVAVTQGGISVSNNDLVFHII